MMSEGEKPKAATATGDKMATLLGQFNMDMSSQNDTPKKGRLGLESVLQNFEILQSYARKRSTMLLRFQV